MSTDPTLQVVIVRDLDLTATFQPDSVPPSISIDRVLGGPQGAALSLSAESPRPGAFTPLHEKAVAILEGLE